MSQTFDASLIKTATAPVDDGMEPMRCYVAAPPLEPRTKEGNIDPRCPDSLLGPNFRDYSLCVITTGENHHPDEEALMDAYVKQQVAKREGTYDGFKDPPVMLGDLIPRVFIVLNRVFSERELLLGGEKMIADYCDSLAARTDFEVIPCYVGKQTLLLPQHLAVPKKYKDPILNAHMEGFYKSHTEKGQELMDRVAKAQEESRSKRRAAIAKAKQDDDKYQKERAAPTETLSSSESAAAAETTTSGAIIAEQEAK
jgi:hypothetical protein